MDVYYICISTLPCRKTCNHKLAPVNHALNTIPTYIIHTHTPLAILASRIAASWTSSSSSWAMTTAKKQMAAKTMKTFMLMMWQVTCSTKLSLRMSKHGMKWRQNTTITTVGNIPITCYTTAPLFDIIIIFHRVVKRDIFIQQCRHLATVAYVTDASSLPGQRARHTSTVGHEQIYVSEWTNYCRIHM